MMTATICTVRNIALLAVVCCFVFILHSFSSVRDQKNRCQGLYASLEEKQESLQAQLKVALDRRNECYQNYREAKKENAGYIKKLGDVESESKGSSDKYSKLQRSFVDLKQKHEQLQADYKRTQEESNNQQSAHDKEVGDIGDKNRQLKVEMEHQASQLKDEIANLKREKMKVEAERDDLLKKSGLTKLPAKPQEDNESDDKRQGPDKHEAARKQILPPNKPKKQPEMDTHLNKSHTDTGSDDKKQGDKHDSAGAGAAPHQQEAVPGKEDADAEKGQQQQLQAGGQQKANGHPEQQHQEPQEEQHQAQLVGPVPQVLVNEGAHEQQLAVPKRAKAQQSELDKEKNHEPHENQQVQMDQGGGRGPVPAQAADNDNKQEQEPRQLAQQKPGGARPLQPQPGLVPVAAAQKQGQADKRVDDAHY